MRHSHPILLAIALFLPLAAPVHAVDEAAAKALLKESKCLTCHSVDKKKDGPSFKETAAKYRGKPDAEAKLIKHVTVPSQIEVDGEMEDRGIVKTRDPAKVANLVQWILSR